MQAEFLLQRELNDSLSCGQLRSSNFRPHFHSHIEIYLILSGELEVFINNKRKLLKEGDISVSMCYDVHAYNTPVNSEAYYIIIPTKFFGEFLSVLTNKHSSSPFIDDPDTYKTIKDAIEHIIAKPNDISRQGYIYVILGAILEHMSVEECGEAQGTHFFPELLIYLNKNFREELTLPMLAEKFGYNPSYLSRSFHQTFGISFGKYLTMLRLREAILLMNKGEMNITECAFESGFGSMRSFYRAFHEEFGCPPKEYLNAKKKKQL